MASENLGRQFQNLSTINKIGISLAGFNAVGLILAISILSSLAGVKAELQSAIDNSTERFNATLSEAEFRINSAVDQAVAEIGSRGTTLTCSGTYNGSLSLTQAPDSFRLTGSIIGNSIYGNLQGQRSILDPIGGRNTEGGSLKLSCK
jgi:hypothetical protein